MRRGLRHRLRHAIGASRAMLPDHAALMAEAAVKRDDAQIRHDAAQCDRKQDRAGTDQRAERRQRRIKPRRQAELREKLVHAG